MARSDAVWGIDIGNASLKALRCRLDPDDDARLIADAFDYIEYPKILTQPDAEPGELLSEALGQFLSRNVVRGDQVAISVSGQNGLARFIKLPPVESKKIPDIVRYEARQQIPFDLDDVVWDYQRMGGGAEEEGFALETEIGLFAMKREQVFRALEPFDKASIEVDFVQLSPLALYNYLSFDQLHDLPPIEDYDPENPPPSIVILSMGTDATDLVITNGYRVWQRSIPLGGNHFTKALTKELKLTFAKAEHIKRNATAAEDPKAVFQAMRPVFNDLLTEIQRSISFFTGLDRNAKIGRVVTLGSAMKLPGLRRYLAQSLGFDVERIDAFRGLVGNEVVGAPAFKENLLCFGVSYGLCLQGLRRCSLRTNLLPPEIVRDRIIRAKKPWAIATAALLLVGLTISFVSGSRSLAEAEGRAFQEAEAPAKQVISESQRLLAEKDELTKQYEGFDQIRLNLFSNVEDRRLWLELLRAINECLPRDAEGVVVEKIEDRQDLHVESIDCQRIPAVEKWIAVMKGKGWLIPSPLEEEAAAATGVPGDLESPESPDVGSADTTNATDGAAEDDATGASGEGWLIRICGYHYHNREIAGKDQGAQYVRDTFIRNLHTKTVEFPGGEPDASGTHSPEVVSMMELGISHPALVNPRRLDDEILIPPGAKQMEGGMGGPSRRGVGDEDEGLPKPIKLKRFNFDVQFLWNPTPPSKRAEARAGKTHESEPADADSDV